MSKKKDLVFNVKLVSRKKLPTFLTKNYQEAKKHTPKDRIPILSLHEDEGESTDLVLMHWRDLEKLAGFENRMRSLSPTENSLWVFRIRE